MNDSDETTIVYSAPTLSCRDAERLAQEVKGRGRSRLVVLDLQAAGETCTCALATLILLRRDLLNMGRDLRIRGMRGRTAGLYEVSRLADILPLEDAPEAALPKGQFCRLDNRYTCKWRQGTDGKMPR